MKIRLAMLEKDSNYLDRIVDAFKTRYSDEFEIYSFTDSELAMSALVALEIDVFVANSEFNIDMTKIPVCCGFAYFVDKPGLNSVREQQAICKFQKIDLIYKQILSVYSESTENVTEVKTDDENCKLVIFSSPSGGVGSSTMAAAYALHLSNSGKKTLYLNLERYGSSDLFFFAEGQFNIGDVIFALKSRKADLTQKLESCVKKDKRGVYFYSQSKVALDMVELGTEEILFLISKLKSTGLYDYIVLDMDFSIEKKYLDIYQKAQSIVVVGDGSEISNMKIRRAYEALLLIEKGSDSGLSERFKLLYNKYRNGISIIMEDISINNIGGMPLYEQVNTEQLLSRLSVMGVFNKIA